MATAASIYETARNNRNEHGVAYVTGKDVAVLIRAALKKSFPGVKFGVRMDGGNCVRVSWTDGPRYKDVNAVVNQFTFGGFDGSIDMAYSSRNWLLPSGEMIPADSSGTSGSGGYVSGYATDCPQPGAVLVNSPLKYTSLSRDMSPEFEAELRRKAAARFGITDQPELPAWQVRCEGQDLTYYMQRTEEAGA
jgi:hypothetical protein